MFTSRPGAKKKVAVLAFILAAFFFGKLVCDIRSDRDTALNHAEQHARGLASALNEHALRTFNGAEATIDSITRGIAAASESGIPDERLLKQLFAAYRTPESVYATLFVTTPNGLLHAISSEYPLRRIDVSDREYYRHHISSRDGALFISKPFKNRLDQDWLITATKRVTNRDGSLRMIVGVSFRAKYFSSFYSTLELTPGDRILLVRRDGAIVALGPFNERYLDHDLSNAALFPLQVQQKHDIGSYRFAHTPLDGTDRIVGYCSTPGYPVVAVISLDQQVRLKQWSSRALRDVVGSSLLLSLVLALALLIRSQVRRLQQANQRLSAQQSELSRAKRRSQEIVNSIDGVVWEFDLKSGRFSFVSERSAALTGFAAAEWLADPSFWRSRVPEGDTTWAERLEPGQPPLGSGASFDYRFRHRDGRLIWLRDLVTVVGEPGHPQRLRGVMLDASQEKQAQATLGEYRQAVEASLDMVCVVDGNYRFLMANQAFLDFLDYQRQDLLGLNMAEVLGERRFAELKPHLDRCLAGALVNFEQQTRSPSGALRQFSITYSPVEELGTVTRVACVARDTSESKRAEHALRESEERYRRISNAVTDYIYTVRLGEDGKISTSHGAGCLGVTGYTEEELAADPYLWLTMVPQQDREQVRRHAADLLRNGSTQSLEHRITRKDGELRWVRNTPVPRFDTSGRFAGYEGLIQDITERRNAEAALSVSEQRFRQLLENVNLLSMILDRDGKITFCNEFLLKLTGWQRHEALGADWFELCVPQESRAALRTMFDEGMANDRIPAHLESALLTREGLLRSVAWDNTVLHNADGSVAGIAAIGTDNTQQRVLEEQLRQAQKMEATGLLAGGIAHDFNNILTVIIGYCSVMQMHLSPEDPNRSSVDQVLAAAERAAGLTRSLLAFSRKQVMNPRQVDLNAIVRQVEHFLCRVIGEDITLDTRLSGTPLHVLADSGQIEQILMNLATNARDAMPDGGTLMVRSATIDLEPGQVGFSWCNPGRYALLSVADTGTGMDEHTRAKIFEPFFTTKEVGKGTGLGLAMAYGIVMQHSGQIMVESEPGRGTTFKVYLPLIEQFEQPRRNDLPRPEPHSGHELILVAEDESAVRELVHGILTSFGYRVLLASDGEEAVEVFRAHQDAIDLVLLDLIMPRLSGKAAYDAIQELRPGTRALFTSGYTADVIRSKGELGPDTELVMKPVHPLVLLKKVRELLDL